MKKLWSLICVFVLLSCSAPSNVVSENLIPLERLNFSNKEINVQGIQLACSMRTGVSRLYYFGEGKAYEILGSWGEEGRSNFIVNLEYKPIDESEERILVGRENGLFCNGFTDYKVDVNRKTLNINITSRVSNMNSENVCSVRNTEYEYGTCEVFNAPDTLKEFLAPFRDQKF
jgi:hypothetical protein